MYWSLVGGRDVTRNRWGSRRKVVYHDGWDLWLAKVLHPCLLSLSNVPPAVQDHKQEGLHTIEVDKICDQLVCLRPYNQILQPVLK